MAAERVTEGDASTNSNLAAEVLQISNLLAQQASDKTGGSYKFSINDFADGGDESFELNRDDALQLIGVLNSKESDIARRELSSLLSRMDRPAVEGMVRRLYGVLQRKNQAISQLETQAAKKSAKGAGRPTSMPQTERRSKGLHTPRDNHSLPGAVEQGTAGHKDSLPPRSPRDSCGGTLLSPRKAKEGGQLEQFKLMQEQQQAEYLRRLKERAGLNQDRSPRSPRSPRGPLPQVFRRLTAPATPPSDQMARIAVANLNLGANKAQVSFGGPLAESTDASQYLDALLEAHREEMTAHDEDIYAAYKQSPRVSEEKAREIFDRLYKNGKDARIRRRVYAELGLLVEQAKEAQMCTFEPRLPLARYPDGFQPQESINERLYQDSFDRRRRREEAKQNVPLPTFRPNMSINSVTSRRSEGGVSPRDTVESEGGFLEGGLTGDGSINRKQSPLHERLYREHADRKARQAHREDAMADWRKHTFNPDIRRSQATGPQIARSGNFFEQLERSRAEDTDGYTMPGGRPLVPLRTMTHPAFEQELSDEEAVDQDDQEPHEHVDVVDEGAPDSPAAPVNSSIEVTSPFEASSYKLNPAAVEVLEAESETPVLDITHLALPAEEIGSQSKEATEELYEMPAADKLSAVCQELKVEAGEAEGESGPAIPPQTNHPTPDMYVHPQAQVLDSQLSPRGVQRRQWVTQPQLPMRMGSGVITRQESGYSLSQGGNSPSMPCRHFSGHILTPRDSSGNVSVALGRAPSMPMAYVATGSSGPAVRTPSMHSQSASSIAGSTLAAWPGSGRLHGEAQDAGPTALSPRVVLSPRISPRVAPIPFVGTGQLAARPMMVPAGQTARYVQPQVMQQVPFQQPPMHPAMSPRPWQVAAMTHR